MTKNTKPSQQVQPNLEEEEYEIMEIPLTPEINNLHKLGGYDPILRTIYINDEINEETAYHIIGSINAIIKSDPMDISPITLYVNSYGGDVFDMFWIIDTMESFAKRGLTINTVGCGKIMSAGAFITIAGTGVRLVHKHTSIMLHEIQSMVGYDNSSKIRDSVAHTDAIEENIFKLISSKSKKPITFWKKELGYKDVYYTPEEAIKLGIIDGIVGEYDFSAPPKKVSKPKTNEKKKPKRKTTRK
jgi:ATP-dependent protease ClpP protease subunit